MDQVISELITQWGVFGLVVVLVGFIIYDNYIKKPKLTKSVQDICVGGCKQGDLIFDSLKDIKESIGARFDGITASIDAVNTKVEVLDEKFETKIETLNDKIQHIPNMSVQKLVENQEKIDKAHLKHTEDVLKLGPKMYNILDDYLHKVNTPHIFIGSFHNGVSSLSGIPYCKFDLVSERFDNNVVIPEDHEFAPVYKDADLLRFGKLPITLAQLGSLHFSIDENNKSDLFNYDDIIVRRMIGMGIKQIALHILKDSTGMISGFLGAVRYDYEKINMDELDKCSKELECVYHAAEKRNKIIK
jgi:hypothetical protein